MLLNEALKLCRTEDKLTQQQVADALGIHVTAYSHYEKGDRFPRRNIFEKIQSLYPHWMAILLSPPIETIIVYPPELLENLRKTLAEIGSISDDYGEAKIQYTRLKESLSPVLSVKYEFLDLPDVKNLGKLSPKTITKRVTLDRCAELLIHEAINLQSSFWDKRFQ